VRPPARPSTFLLAALSAWLIASCAPSTRSVPTLITPTATRQRALATPDVRRVTPRAIRTATAIPASSTPVIRTPSATPDTSKVLDSVVSPIDGAVLVLVPAGSSWMGSSKDERLTEPDEFPLHRVNLPTYWMDQAEVTNQQYTLCVQAGACVPPEKLLLPTDPEPYFGNPAFEAHPVVHVSWEQANDYCTWAERRLPTEAEWERAARGRDARTYPWGWFGALMGDRLNFCDQECPYAWREERVSDGFARTAPVGSFPAGASPYGALDMAGNVWEWVSDWYAADSYPDGTIDEPLGPLTGNYKVVRGGSWLDGTLLDRLAFARAANRHWQDPEAGRGFIGFRCAVADEDLRSGG
jgi:formylglycine-generating enzyme required for sulfatase activity